MYWFCCILKRMQARRAEENSLKNIQNLTVQKMLTSGVYVYIYIY